MAEPPEQAGPGPCLGWRARAPGAPAPGPAPLATAFGWWAAGWAWASAWWVARPGIVSLGLFHHWDGWYAWIRFPKWRLFIISSTCIIYISCKIDKLQYKWNPVNSKGICVYLCLVYSFSDLCWRYFIVLNDRQQVPPSLPFARPWAKSKDLVVDQELLLCRLHFINARFITKISSAIWMKWYLYLPFVYLELHGACS